MNNENDYPKSRIVGVEGDAVTNSNGIKRSMTLEESIEDINRKKETVLKMFKDASQQGDNSTEEKEAEEDISHRLV